MIKNKFFFIIYISSLSFITTCKLIVSASNLLPVTCSVCIIRLNSLVYINIYKYIEKQQQ